MPSLISCSLSDGWVGGEWGVLGLKSSYKHGEFVFESSVVFLRGSAGEKWQRAFLGHANKLSLLLQAVHVSDLTLKHWAEAEAG